MLTVEKILNLSTFEDLKVVSGKEGLHNVIESVNIMDNPNALDWFSMGEMLLTSGYFFKDDIATQNQVMEQLYALNCPALCIKPHPFLGTIPQNMIDLSEKYKLPIIELPYGLSFSTLFLRTMEEISKKFDSINRKILDVQQDFFKISMRDGGLREISKRLSDLLNAHVLLLDTDWRTLDWSQSQANKQDVFLDKLKKEKVPSIPQQISESVPPDFQNIENPITRSLEMDDEKVDFVILPVYFNQIHYGFIAAIQKKTKRYRMEWDIMKSGAKAFALELIKIHEIQRAKNRVRRDFLDELLTGNITSMELLANYADIHGFALHSAYNAVVFDVSFSTHLPPDELIKREQFENAKLKNILSVLDTFNSQQKQNLIIYSRQKQVIVLISGRFNQPEDIAFIKGQTEKIIHIVEDNVSHVTLTAGIGKQYPHLNDVHNSFFEAQATLRILKNTSSQEIVCHYKDYLLHHFLNRNIKSQDGDDFINEVLGNLLAYDLENQSQLLTTLEVWINNRMNIAQAARELFVHRNTLLYRMSKIKDLLQYDLEEPTELLSIQLALTLLNIKHEH